MPKIKLLPELLINKIAAGEVIERPASVVKELIENALDAGSTDVRIEVLKGGKRLIRVSDNGEGMDREDARICFERHATSKVQDEGDLLLITTMGFRGEALSSISAVAKVRMSTVRRGADHGIALELEGGRIRSERETSGMGTTIEVRDLFYNTPVRKKFMRTDGTELYHVIDTVNRAALIRQDVRFLLTSDRKKVLDVYGTKGHEERIAQLYGPEFLKDMIKVEFFDERIGTKIKGFISRPGKTRKTRGNQYLYVNRRPVTDKALRHAIYRGYDEYISRDDHPVFLLDISIDPEDIDVNVHPAKHEIRFLEKERIYNTLLDIVRKNLREAGTVSADDGDKEKEIKRFIEGSGFPLTGAMQKGAQLYEKDPRESSCDTVAETMALFAVSDRPYIYIGDVFVAYVDRGMLCLLDHHAAHERVVYERLRKGVDLGTYRLLFPKQVRLNPKEYDVIIRHRDNMYDMGIELEDFGGNTVIVRALPSLVGEEELEGILSDVAYMIMDFRASSPLEIIRDGIAKSIACHGSVRGKKILGKEQLNSLLSDLDNAEDPYHCPHGRPTRVYYSIEDLKKIFERK